ncbi:hypothetical protein [Vibrio nigripulchritudo]|uniref:hypothetical protein n=1 Tax=Vibrio nigripulchritudo TaxID=28173 RepID=UPI0024935986|nr:hypothetical protein [Vibrio nigripulchritudo]BDU40430.1 hypothetical protein TUMSATVNIG2_48990 [Vibrio nigripulchritudo]BDU46167.1 hypothetical protein TUMSATVNIG3_49650 [Vibrio nigripulchritudo]
MRIRKAVTIVLGFALTTSLFSAKALSGKTITTDTVKASHVQQILSGDVVSGSSVDIIYADISKVAIPEGGQLQYSPWDDLYKCTKGGRLKSESIIIPVENNVHVLQACDALGFELDLELAVVNADVLNEEVSDIEKSTRQVILVPTPSANDTYLYWNGSKFKLYVPMPF